MDKIYKIQNQARNNAKSVHTYMTDLQNWELEMKRKEAALNGQFEQVLGYSTLLLYCIVVL